MPHRTRSKRRRYGYAHQVARKNWTRLLPLPCTVCGREVTAAMRWDLDHNDAGTGYLGPAHRGCNRSKGARKGNRMRGKRAKRREPLRRLEL
ncbi:MAG: hypothetical protein K0S43_402 [Cellulosimicrobium sp.]|nr:hypothetical protein [Cellulosimicrobium sp.]